MQGTMWLFPDSREWGLGTREPRAGSLHYALAHPCPGVGGERLYTLLRPTACQGGEGHAVARGDCRRHAGNRQPSANSRQPKASTVLKLKRILQSQPFLVLLTEVQWRAIFQGISFCRRCSFIFPHQFRPPDAVVVTN